MEREFMESIRSRLVARLLSALPEPGKTPTAIDGLTFTRWNEAGQTDICFYAPAVGVILQGDKQSVIGSETLCYGALDCLVNGVDMPSVSTILSATPEKPLLAISLNIDRNLASEAAADIPPDFHSPRDEQAGCLGVSVARVTPDVLDAFARLADTLDKPEQRALLAPLLVREIISRVLMGPQGGALRMLYAQGSHSNQVAKAITWLRSHYTSPLRIEALASQVEMPVSTFHRQFKKVTSLSPLQFQKCLRLYEAQRLMLAENMDAGGAGRAVGYDSTQQFNREYRRMFGEPPRRNVQRLLRE